MLEKKLTSQTRKKADRTTQGLRRINVQAKSPVLVDRKAKIGNAANKQSFQGPSSFVLCVCMKGQTGKCLILLGAAIMLVGVLVSLLGNKLHWIGRLPGDIRIEKERSRFYFPITTLLLASLLLSLIVHLMKKFL